MVACNRVDKAIKENYTEHKSPADYITSSIFLNAVDLNFTQYSKGCVNEEKQRLEVSTNANNQLVISYFMNEIKVIDKKLFDSSFQIYIKSFIRECKKLEKDTSFKGLVFGTIKTIEISDGLHILKVNTTTSNLKDPFQDLINAVCSKNRTL